MRIGASLPVRELEDDLEAIKDFAQAAEALGYTHLRVPDQVLRKGNKHLHEPMMLLAWIAAATETIELVPSVIVLPSRQTALFAKQAAALDRLSGGRLRLGVGVGGSADEYAALGQDFSSRGRRCDEQLELLKRLWTEATVDYQGRWDRVSGAGLNPLPVQRPIPVWIGGRATPGPAVTRRIGAHANGWFVLCSPEDFPAVKGSIDAAAAKAGRNPATIGTEAGVAVVGPRQAEWRDRVAGWRQIGLTHLCLRTLGGDLTPNQHISTLKTAADEVPGGLQSTS
ncbi:MAG: TIGR03619 family F420-dependent LLM class oxidoreductase [Gammaproteobacteria bacterium]|nr:TIGR03619 family F420-dependent LLM class oxidoreductase [Gammaproteobacteria bacterium]